MVSDGSPIPLLLGLLAAPMLIGLINKLKARFVGRVGAPVLQPYYDVFRLLRKHPVYSRTTSWLFRAGPVASLAGAALALLLIPAAGVASWLSFPGDFVVLAYMLALGRVFTVLAALDTGSSFEGMGASRELFISALAEPALFLVLLGLVLQTRELSLTRILGSDPSAHWPAGSAALSLAVVALLLITLAENSRIPIDDPTTHLELTMVHEVMVLDHSGPEYGFILYAAALKLWIFAALLVGLILPVQTVHPLVGAVLFIAGMAAVALVIGIIESSMARLRLTRVPQFLIAASILGAFSLLLSFG
jgi:formate hydrogenlyase subunit 4